MVAPDKSSPPGALFHPERAWFLVHPKGLVVARESDGRVRLPNEAEAARLGGGGAGHELGRLGDTEAMAIAVEGDPPHEPFVVLGLRELFSAVSAEAFAFAGRATQVIDWATTHRFCGRCATPTERVEGERCMRCPACGHLGYPRIAPAMIVLVRRGDEALLARGARFPLPFFSTLAGFVEIGEALEETVAREVREEVGIEVKDVRYFGSQPWPFPNSLMIGFTAEWAAGEIAIDGKEILEAQWCRADALPAIPPRISIARRLIDAWVEDVLGLKR
jgi:NAD+ diphosphatase